MCVKYVRGGGLCMCRDVCVVGSVDVRINVCMCMRGLMCVERGWMG